MDRIVLATLNKFCKIASRPFSEAESLEGYATSGYVLLGLATGLILLTIAVVADPLDEPSSLWKTFYKIAIQQSPLKFLPSDPRSVLVIPAVIYIAIYFWPTGRIWLGEKFANFFFWLVDRFLATGEWCLEHRWVSLFLVIALVGALGYGVTREIEKARRHDVVKRDYEHWLILAEDWIEHSSLTHAETDRYKNVQRNWHDEFVSITDSQMVGRSGVCLKGMLDDLYSTDEQGSWIERLASTKEILERRISSCRPERPESDSQQRALSLMQLLLGRVYSRVFDVTRDVKDLVRALDHFDAVEPIDRVQVGSAVSPYHFSVTNAKGTVYADLVTVFPDTSLIVGPSLPDAILKLCDRALDCALKAFNSYEEAGRGFTKCSFEDKRRMNNEADLLIRMAKRYPGMMAEKRVFIFDGWFDNPSTFAAELERRANALLSCTSSGPFVSATFLTAAQAFGAAAQLRPNTSEEASLDARGSSFYLQLASGFEPVEVSNWDLSYFCFVTTNQGLEREFRSQLAPPIIGPISEDQLIAFVRKQCR